MKPIGIVQVLALPELTKAQEIELERRLDAYRKDPTAGLPWPEVKARHLRAAADRGR